ncbi:hypothetical protein H0H87_012086 [Tephrocybe sp. NHM501043]|nr:hypothetical protein H0H87_012086 [Tephrocybe sp. NHM501043]
MGVKTLLITGATGKQGSALISALRPQITTEPSPFHILALTRNAQSPAAKRLSSDKFVDVVEGDLDDEPSLRKIFENAKDDGGIWGIFCVLAFPGLGANADNEEKQGKTLVDLAVEFSVSFFLFSSYERGGESFDDSLTLDRLAKVRIERHIRRLSTESLNWTILRPGFFMENFEGIIGSFAVGALKLGLKPDTTIQLIAVEDIGHVASAVFKAPEKYASQVLVVVGDICTMNQVQDAYTTATGRAIPSIPNLLARFIIRINGHTQNLIADMERVHLMRIDPANEENRLQMAVTHEAYPKMTSLGTWAARQQARSLTREKGWNNVSIGRLIRGKQ